MMFASHPSMLYPDFLFILIFSLFSDLKLHSLFVPDRCVFHYSSSVSFCILINILSSSKFWNTYPERGANGYTVFSFLTVSVAWGETFPLANPTASRKWSVIAHPRSQSLSVGFIITLPAEPPCSPWCAPWGAWTPGEGGTGARGTRRS